MHVLLLLASAGCVATHADDERRSTAFNLAWQVGGGAMAVDGDHLDDRTGWLDDDEDCQVIAAELSPRIRNVG